MATDTIRAAIIGCGVIAPNHAKALALDSRTRLAWACDSDVAKARATLTAGRYSADWREVLADPGVDLVCIATPHATHADICCAALAAGKHVICEKPLATRPEDLERMVAAAAASKRMASGIFQHRFSPLIRRVRQLVGNGDFGTVESAELDFRCTRNAAYYASGPWRGRWDGEGGGLMINQAIHSFDLMNWMCGKPLTIAGKVERRLLGDAIEVEDFAEATLAHDGGAVSRLGAVNDLATNWGIRLRVTCSQGSFILGDEHDLSALEHANGALKAELHALDQARSDAIKMPGKACYGDYHALQFADCLDAVVSGRPPMVPLAEAALTAHAVLGLYHSSALGGATVELPVTGYRHPVIASRPAQSAVARP